MGKVRHDALPEKVQNISENLWEQAETVLRMNNNKGNAQTFSVRSILLYFL